MPGLTFDALLKHLKRAGPDPVYYLHGEEDVLKDEAVRALVDRALEPAARDFNLDVRAAAELDAETVAALLNTPPMLAERRVVVLRGVEQMRKKSKARDALIEYLRHPSAATVLVLLQNGGDPPEADLARAATAVAVERLAPERVSRWVAHTASQRGLTLAPEAALLLVQTAGAELGVLSQELDKLTALTNGRPATAADVSALVGARHGETLQDLIKATLTRHAALAARLVEPVLDQAGMSGVRILSAIGTALLGTALARAELDRGTPHARLPDTIFRHLLKARPYGLDNWKDTSALWAASAEAWTAEELSRALRLALETDRALKTTTVSDEAALLRQLVLYLGALAREAA
ncbi:MAG TPA: DNA polymerase III subunit delta [Gemmatimonadales bacterium]|nr:DNA polymerase III subunit delta [Gemmatimonadales bacterium]